MQARERNGSSGGSATRAGLVRGLLVIVTALAVGFFVIRGLDDGGADSVETAAADDSLEGAPLAEGDDDSAGDGESDPGSESAGAGGGADPADTADEDDVAGAMVDAEPDTDGTDDADAMDDDAAGADADAEAETTDPAGPETGTPADIKVLVLNGAGPDGIAGRGSAVLQEADYDVMAPKNASFLGPTQVLYLDGFEDDAAAVAEVFGVDPQSVVAPFDPANPPINDIGQAQIVVVIGSDGLIDV